MRSIEARYGLNVASFFHFMRYVIFCFFLLGCMNLCTYVWHITDILHSQVRYNATNGTALNNGSRISNWGYTLSKARELKGTCLFDEYLQNTVCTLEYSKYSKASIAYMEKHCSWHFNSYSLFQTGCIALVLFFSIVKYPNKSFLTQ